MSAAVDDIVVAARAWIGTPYRHQAATLGAGCDCLGLVRGVWRMVYGAEPPMAVPPYGAGLRDPAFADGLLRTAEALLVRADGPPRAGQVVLFRLRRGLTKHCGIMVSDQRFVHAQEQLGVVEANLTEGWAERVAGVFGFP